MTLITTVEWTIYIIYLYIVHRCAISTVPIVSIYYGIRDYRFQSASLSENALVC